MKQIASRDNPTFKRLRALLEDGRYRRLEQAAVLDGVHLIEAARAAQCAIRRVVVTARALQMQEIGRLVNALAATGSEIIEMPEALLRALSPVETPSGILGEIAIPDAVSPSALGDVLVIEAVQDAGNLGTLLRTAAAVGIRRVWLSEHCAQAWSPKVLRAGMGAHFVLSIAEHVDLNAALDGWQGKIIATALDVRSQDLFDLDLRPEAAWMFGSEGSGLSASLIARATDLARIPMPGGIESLNVAAAAAVCLFEQLRQRKH
ncbi:RNA methyltransferase [Uliginosibacterium sp. H3]|uniref:RNA methyltransferase n=1 Tax=Uliginosibacterium silvisoli TaxID=3114758 RepID=A0ABU6K4I1_9RHOO|nr:RNA methyltransferase [Uliginosibacterium sp. H3]